MQNVLWIMADQLRWDYLSCYGHPHLHTPNIDSLAERGVLFRNAYVQSPVCGPSRMSYYTGRYCRSHGSTWNGFPLRVGEPTLGDHLRDVGVRSALVGKTHMKVDVEGMRRLGLSPESNAGVLASQCGFEPFERDDGVHPYTLPGAGKTAYDDYLRSKGYESENPWNDFANSTVDDKGDILSGWLLKSSPGQANIAEEDSETPYMTRRAMDFMADAGDQPWCLHLSYIKPHWPYIVPAPYHNMYGPEDVLPVIRNEAEREAAHPIYDAFMEQGLSKVFWKEGTRQAVIPAYMGLIKQIDDQLGLLFAFMEERGLMDNTMIVVTSDHGDYLGDHWLGEKDLFHDASSKTPLIIYDPRKEADETRGQVRDELVEGIDLAPTFLSYFGGEERPHILEGRDLTPLLHQPEAPENWRRYAVSEYDYCGRLVPEQLGIRQEDARLVMLRDDRWKFIHAEGFRPMLYDLESDPDELVDLGASTDPEHVEVIARMEAAMNAWARQHHNRITVDAAFISRISGTEPPGCYIGFWDEQDFEDRLGFPFSDTAEASVEKKLAEPLESAVSEGKK